MSAIRPVSIDPPGSALSRLIIALGLNDGDAPAAREQAKSSFASLPQVQYTLDAMVNKAAVPAGRLGDGAWAGNLAGFGLDTETIQLDAAIGDSILPRLALYARAVPFRQPVPRVLSAGDTSWIAEGEAMPATADMLDQIAGLSPTKRGAVRVFSRDLRRVGDVAAERAIRESLIRGVQAALGRALFDPSSGPSAAGPASLTFGAPEVALGSPSLVTPLDLDSMLRQIQTTGTGLVWVATARTMARALLTSGRVEPVGRLAGLPTLIGAGVPDGLLVLLDASELLLAVGGFELDVTTQASLELRDDPTQSGVTATGSVAVSLFQNNLFAVRLLRYANWTLARPSAITFARMAL